jgi:hypothetical protein
MAIIEFRTCEFKFEPGIVICWHIHRYICTYVLHLPFIWHCYL